MSRFLRENSQFIASILITGYAGITVMFRINKGDLVRDRFEFKTKSNSYLGISLKDEEEAKKFMYRLSEAERNIEFFRSNTLDFVSFGFNKLKQGGHIGFPPSYFAKSTSDIASLTPFSGFRYFLGQNISLDDINKKLGPEQIEKLYQSIVLSNDAKIFGLAREVAATESFMRSNLDHFIEFICMSGAYMYSYVKTRAYKMQFFQRRRVFVTSCVIALAVILGSKFLIAKLVQGAIDFKACQMGLDCCIGSLEFYDKMLERNKLLREVLINGHSLIDSNGNYLKQAVYIPLTDFYFYINFMGIKLTDRRENCKIYLNDMIKKLNEQMEIDEKKAKELEPKSQDEPVENKELKLFNLIKQKLESIFKNN